MQKHSGTNQKGTEMDHAKRKKTELERVIARMGLKPMTADEALETIDQVQRDVQTMIRLKREGLDIYDWFKYIGQ